MKVKLAALLFFCIEVEYINRIAVYASSVYCSFTKESEREREKEFFYFPNVVVSRASVSFPCARLSFGLFFCMREWQSSLDGDSVDFYRTELPNQKFCFFFFSLFFYRLFSVHPRMYREQIIFFHFLATTCMCQVADLTLPKVYKFSYLKMLSLALL